MSDISTAIGPIPARGFCEKDIDAWHLPLSARMAAAKKIGLIVLANWDNNPIYIVGRLFEGLMGFKTKADQDNRLHANGQDGAAMLRHGAGTGVSELRTKAGLAGRISRFALQQRSRIDAVERAEGPRRLMWAILKDSLFCYHAYAKAQSVREQRLFGEVERWVQSRDFGWVFSFENVCAVLNIDSEHLRNELRRWRRAQRSGAEGRMYGTRRA